MNWLLFESNKYLTNYLDLDYEKSIHFIAVPLEGFYSLPVGVQK